MDELKNDYAEGQRAPKEVAKEVIPQEAKLTVDHKDPTDAEAEKTNPIQL